MVCKRGSNAGIATIRKGVEMMPRTPQPVLGQHDDIIMPEPPESWLYHTPLLVLANNKADVMLLQSAHALTGSPPCQTHSFTRDMDYSRSIVTSLFFFFFCCCFFLFCFVQLSFYCQGRQERACLD